MDLLKVYSISDIHVDYEANLALACRFSHDSKAILNALIVAGDVTHDRLTLLNVLTELSAKFDFVFFIPGNHDVWCPEHENSNHKYGQLLSELSNLGIYTTTTRIVINDLHSIIFTPVHGWSEDSFDQEPDVRIPFKIPQPEQLYSDFQKTMWSAADLAERVDDQIPATRDTCDYEALNHAFGISGETHHRPLLYKNKFNYRFIDRCISRYNHTSQEEITHIFSKSDGGASLSVRVTMNFTGINKLCEANYREVQRKNLGDIISFSHFVPFQFLSPEKRFLLYPYLSRTIGSETIGKRVIAISPTIHVFGHTHFGWYSTIRDMRHGSVSSLVSTRILETLFVSMTFSYPHEREQRPRSIEVDNTLTKNEDFVIYRITGDFNREIPNRAAYWSDMYKNNLRDPNNTKPADYVLNILEKYV